MNTLLFALAALTAAAVLAALWAWSNGRRDAERADAAEAKAEALGAKLQQAGAEMARLEERARHLDETSAKVADAFKAMSAEAVNQAADSLLKRAEETFTSRDKLVQERITATLAPVAETLTKFEAKVGELEKARAEDSGGLKAQIEALMVASTATQNEAKRLSAALTRSPGVRGRWGEQTLRNVLEASGMTDRVDFHEQVSVSGEEGTLRPDVLVRLPGGGVFVIDSKVSLNDYLASVDAADDVTREASLKAHANSVRRHMSQLSSKAYWSQFDKPPHSRSPDLVAMFVPLESCLACVMERHPELMTDAWRQRVAIVTPTGLAALLRAVAYGWRAEDQAKGAREIAEAGRELHKRVAVMAKHAVDMGAALDRAVGKYNDFAGSLERNVMSQARRFEALAAQSDKDLPEIPTLDGRAKPLLKLGVAEDTLQ